MNDDIITIFLLTIATILSVAFDISILRPVIGIIFILFCPGYALIAALFTKAKDLDAIERIALSFGLSIAVVPLIGLGLNYTSWGIRLAPILVANSLFTFVMLALAFWRRRTTDKEDRFTFSYHMPKVELGESKVDRALSIVLIISIVVALGALVYVIQAPKKGETFTEFYILGPGGMADSYPKEFVLGESKLVIVGIVNHEYETATYIIEMVLEGGTIWSKTYTLGDGDKIEEEIQITPLKIGEDMKLEFLLFKGGEQYRDLHLWITVTGQ